MQNAAKAQVNLPRSLDIIVRGLDEIDAVVLFAKLFALH
jgi:hypothetical protein